MISITKNDRTMQNCKAFTLIEMMIVLAIIAILALLALPDSSSAIKQAQVQESLKLIERYKSDIATYYQSTETFPLDNDQLGIPEPKKLIGNYVSEIEIEKGAVHLLFGTKAHQQLAEKQLSVRPVFVPSSSQSPISWVCGYDVVPSGMLASGVDKTDIEPIDLPLLCR